jgi:hypothetical protein
MVVRMPDRKSGGRDCTRLSAIDDDTCKVLAAVFREQEDRIGYFQLVEPLIRRYGRP